MEWLLIDKLVHASTEEMRWLQQAVSSRACQWNESGRESREVGRRVAPRMSFAASTDQAMAMATDGTASSAGRCATCDGSTRA